MQNKCFKVLILFFTFVFLLLHFSFSCFAQQAETIELSTYYPAPYGVYNELKAKRMWIGTTGVAPNEQFLSGGNALLRIGSITFLSNPIYENAVASIVSLNQDNYSIYAVTQVSDRNNADRAAIKGIASGFTGRRYLSFGVSGSTYSDSNINQDNNMCSAGAYGETFNGQTAGILGKTSSGTDNSFGVRGITDTSKLAFGVKGEVSNTAAAGSAGVFGFAPYIPPDAEHFATQTYGVIGQIGELSDVEFNIGLPYCGIFGKARDVAGICGYSVNSIGVSAFSKTDKAIYAESKEGYSSINAFSQNHWGVFSFAGGGLIPGNLQGTGGVYGFCNTGIGVKGEGSTGIQGLSATNIGIQGITSSTTYQACGVRGEATTNGVGIAGAGETYGIRGAISNRLPNSAGVFGTSAGGNSQTYGVRAYSSSTNVNGAAIYASSGFNATTLIVERGTGLAARFEGPVIINGTFDATAVTARVKNFKVNHPLDPKNKDLIHACIEGPEAAVYYRGEAQLNNGKTEITLPAYFEKLTRKENRTVQLTCLDSYSPLFANGGIKNGKFVVETTKDGNLNQKFFWEIKAVRADIEPLKVEVPKEK